jgi:hypothetical protein
LKNDSENEHKNAIDNIDKQSLANLQAFSLKEENAYILKYLNGRIYFNKFFELADLKNTNEIKMYFT